MSTARAIEALKDLASSQLVVVDDGGDVIFTHPLLRRALAEDLDDERRRDLHVLAAGVLEGWLPSGSTDLVFDIASHWDEAAAGLVDDRAARACLRAAELAEPVAPTVAARWFERTLAHLPLDRKERVALHLRTVYAYLTTWSYREALAANSAAERELADSPAYGIIALAGALCRMMSGDPAHALKRLLALAPTAPLPEPTRFVRVAMEFLLRHTVGEPDQGGVGWAAIEAMAPAAADEDLVETVLGEIFLAAYASQNGLLDAFTRHADRIVRAGRLSPEASGRELVATAVYLDLIGPADLARASDLLTSVAAGPVEDIRSIAMHGPATATAWCLLHWTAGNLVAAQQLARDAAAEMRSRRAGMLLAVVECIDALVGLECDQLREAERVVEQLEPRNPADAVLCDLARARHLQARGQVTAATTILEERWAAAVARGTVPFTALLAEELVVVLQAAGRDADAAALADDSLRRTVDHGMPLPEVQALRAVTRASGDPEPCRRALLVADERGYVFEALLCRQVLGSMGEAPRGEPDGGLARLPGPRGAALPPPHDQGAARVESAHPAAPQGSRQQARPLADRIRGAAGQPDPAGADQPADRRAALPVAEDGRGLSQPALPDARCRQPDRAHRAVGGERAGVAATASGPGGDLRGRDRTTVISSAGLVLVGAVVVRQASGLEPALGDAPAVLEDVQNLVLRQGWREEEALGEAAAEVDQLIGLVLAFDALGHHAHAEGLAEPEHRTHQRGIVAAVRDSLHEAPVDLELRDREPLQVGERGVPRPEVVDRDAHPTVLQLGEQVVRTPGVGQHQVLGDLQGQARGGHPEVLEGALHQVGQVVPLEVHG